jgi:hypothetical protein
MMLRTNIWIVFIFCAAWLSAQQDEFFLGKIEDSSTGEPVVFANIRIKDRALGIITNVDGSFRIPLRYKEYGDIIEISSMGYETKEIPISGFSQEGLNIISLNPSAISLQEAVVKAKDKRGRRLGAKRIVQKAIDAIPNNYPTTSFSTIGYYRDYQFNEGEYINLNEGIMEVYDQGFDQSDDATSEIQVFNFELNKDFKQDSIARTAYDYDNYKKIIKKAYLGAYGGNEYRILRIHDAIRNFNAFSYDYIGTLKYDLIKNHKFLRSSDSESDNEALYGIKFWQIHLNYRAHGEIFISKKDFAIHRLEYTMYDAKRMNKEGEKNKHGHKQKVIFDILTEYRKINNKMYLNYISFHNSFEVRKPPKFALDSTLVDMPGGYYSLYFNNPVDSLTAINPKNYDILYQQKKYKIEKIKVFQDSVRLFGDAEFREVLYNTRGDVTSLTNKRRDSEAEQMFGLGIENVRDIYGNLVNEPDIREYQQFREFFTQRVKPDSRAPFDGKFMDKEKPLFKDQPMVKPKDYREYWMNTPLQEKIN